MRVSHPIDQLIHDLEHERAKDYWERVKRFRSSGGGAEKGRQGSREETVRIHALVASKPG